jgi:hypothetical protein
MAGEIHLDVLSGRRRPQHAGTPVHDAVGAGIDRGGGNRQVAGDGFPDLRIVVDAFRKAARQQGRSRLNSIFWYV